MKIIGYNKNTGNPAKDVEDGWPYSLKGGGIMDQIWQIIMLLILLEFVKTIKNNRPRPR